MSLVRLPLKFQDKFCDKCKCHHKMNYAQWRRHNIKNNKETIIDLNVDDSDKIYNISKKRKLSQQVEVLKDSLITANINDLQKIMDEDLIPFINTQDVDKVGILEFETYNMENVQRFHTSVNNNMEIINTWKEYQIHKKEKLMNILNNNKKGWIKNNLGITTHSKMEDLIHIWNYGTKYLLSYKMGDDLLELINNLCSSNNVSINLPKTYRSICESLSSDFSNNYVIKELFSKMSDIHRHLEFPPCSLNQDIVVSIGVYIPVMEVISTVLLKYDSNQFHFNGDAFDNININHFCSAEVFNNTVVELKYQFGNEVHLLSIGVNVDDTVLDGLGKNTAAPIYITFNNLKYPYNREPGNIHLIGYCPKFQVVTIIIYNDLLMKGMLKCYF